LVNPITYTQDVLEIDPNEITISKIPISDLYKILKHTSKATTRPAPGRKFGYAVWHDESLIGVMGISSPVINLGVRDDYLNFPKNSSEKGTVLRHYVDLSTCVGLQPISWYWNIGKLIAMLATSKTISEQYKNHYGDELRGIITTSINGKSVQYNRVYKFLGYTKGYGHEHISDEQYHEMLDWMKQNNVEIPSSRFGAGSNPRMRRIAAYNKAKGIKSSMKHGKKRGVYYSPCTNESIEKIVKNWYDRWGRPRYERVKDKQPPYKNGLE
tara:strand:+ start:1304 stop:2110 length:807 start_codon:yes stop_codon:yes gene_type:complete